MACTAIEHLLARTLSLQMELGKVIEEGNQTSTTLDYLRYQSEMLYEHAARLSPLDNNNNNNNNNTLFILINVNIDTMNRRYQRLSLSRVSPFKSKQFKSTQLNLTL